GVSSSTGGTVSGPTGGHDQAGTAGTAAAAEGRNRVGVGVAPNEGGGVANAPPPPSSRLPPVPRPKGSPCSGLVSSVGSLSPPRFVGGDSMFLVSDIEEGKERWFRRGSPTGTATAGGGGIGRRGSISGGGTR
ncbi:unnamed protein product, partial [Ectocarpus fasciculatus]